MRKKIKRNRFMNECRRNYSCVCSEDINVFWEDDLHRICQIEENKLEVWSFGSKVSKGEIPETVKHSFCKESSVSVCGKYLVVCIQEQ